MKNHPKGSAVPTIHVLEVIGNAIVGGMENYVFNLVQQLPAYGFKISCLAPYESPYTAGLRRLGVDVYVSEMHVNVPLRTLQFTTELVRLKQVDLLHAHLGRAHILAGIAGQLAGVPAVATIHGMDINTEELGISMLTGTHLVTVCQPAYSQALALGMPEERVTLIPNGVDIKQFSPESSGYAFRAENAIPPDVPLIGFVGRVSHEKGPDLFVRLAAAIHAQNPGVHFAMVGVGPMLDEVQQLTRSLGLAEVMHFTGLSKHPWEVYPAFTLQALTSRVEGMPFALLEGMACGVPSLVFAVGGVPEIVEVETTGLTSAAEDVQGLAQAALRLMRDPDRLREMGAAARKRVEENFDLYNSLRLTGTLFRSLLQLDPDSRSKGWPGVEGAPLPGKQGKITP